MDPNSFRQIYLVEHICICIWIDVFVFVFESNLSKIFVFVFVFEKSKFLYLYLYLYLIKRIWPQPWINNKLEKIQEPSLCILFSDYESNAHDLLDNIGGQTLALRRLNFMLLEVYTCIKKVNSLRLCNLSNTNTTHYQLRTSKLEQPLRRATRHRLRTFSYVGSHLWNSVLNDRGDIVHVDFN